MGFIRFILACSVVLCHTSLIFGYEPVTGNLAVQCFYIISGFYMALILNEKYCGKNSTKLFYINRALKIYPIYWINLILLVLWAVFVYKAGYPSTLTFYNMVWPLPAATLIYFVLVNIFLVGLDSIFLFGITKGGGLYFTPNFNKTDPVVYNFAFNSIAWTIGIELLFYLLAPFIARRKIVYPAAILVLSLLLRIVLIHRGFDNAPWDYMFFPTQLMFFMGGILSYHLYKKMRTMQLSNGTLWAMYGCLLVVTLLYYQFFQESYLKQFLLFLIFILCMPGTFMLTKHSRADRLIGNLSYPVYISQSLIIKIMVIKKIPKLFGLGFSTLVVVIIFALLLEFLVMQPIEKYRQSRVKGAIA